MPLSLVGDQQQHSGIANSCKARPRRGPFGACHEEYTDVELFWEV